MIQNKLFRDCLAAIPAEQKAEFDLSFGIAERISEILKAKGKYPLNSVLYISK